MDGRALRADRNDRPGRDVSLPGSGRAVSAVPRWLAITYWLLPVGLTILQGAAVVAAMHRLRFEEAAESIRNVFWLHHRFAYDGYSNSIGWYALLLAVYKVFGFSLYTAKWVKLGLYSLGLFCAADILRRSLTVPRAIVPLIVCGLSPTILYFNTIQTTFAVDVSYFSICLWILSQTRIRAPRILDYAGMFLAGTIAMISAESYAAFNFYIPTLLLFIDWRFRQESIGKSGLLSKSNLLLSGSLITGFLLPLVVSLIAVRNPQLLIRDPHNYHGLFRGGARLGWDLDSSGRALAVVAGDFFRRGNSYYFENAVADFRGFLSLAGFVTTMVTSAYLLVVAKSRRPLLLAAVFLLLLSVIVPAFCVDFVPGIRRSTGAIAAFFILFAFSWNFFCTHPFAKGWMRPLGLGLCALVLAGDLVKYPPLLRGLRHTGVYFDEPAWFRIKSSPTESLDYYLSQTANGIPLTCPDNADKTAPCRYSEIYGALQGYRLWNHKAPVEVEAWDWTAGTYVVLRPELWVDYHFPH